MDIRQHDGWAGVFCTDEAEGAWPNGTRIEKVWSEKGDRTPLGTKGTVLGSVFHPDMGYAYFLEWDNAPKVAVFTVAKKIGLAGGNE